MFSSCARARLRRLAWSNPRSLSAPTSRVSARSSPTPTTLALTPSGSTIHIRLLTQLRSDLPGQDHVQLPARPSADKSSRLLPSPAPTSHARTTVTSLSDRSSQFPARTVSCLCRPVAPDLVTPLPTSPASPCLDPARLTADLSCLDPAQVLLCFRLPMSERVKIITDKPSLVGIGANPASAQPQRGGAGEP